MASSENLQLLSNLAQGSYEFFLRDKKAQLDRQKFTNFQFLTEKREDDISVGVSFNFPDAEINYDKDDLHNFKGKVGYHKVHTSYCKDQNDLLNEFHAVLTEIANGFLI